MYFVETSIQNKSNKDQIIKSSIKELLRTRKKSKKYLKVSKNYLIFRLSLFSDVM